MRALRTVLLGLALSACESAAPQSPRDATTTTDVADAADAARDAASTCPDDVPPPYPTGDGTIRDGAPLPDLRFATEAGAVSLAGYYAPCAATPRLLVVRVFTAWSGPSRWHAAHTSLLARHPEGARLTVLDVLALGQENLPAQPRDLAPWRTRYDIAPGELGGALAVDPEYRFRSLFFGGGELPIVVLVDTRTMRAARVLLAPTSDALTWEVSAAVARMDGRARPTRPEPRLHDERFSDDQWDQIRAMTPLPAAPPDPTNAVADDPRAAELGRALFSDTGLSPSGTVACATCHAPDRAFADGRPRGVGVAEGDRNTPTVLLAGHAPWQFWDGRADTLWAQALGPVENPVEMASSRLHVAHAVAARHRAAYEALFGPLPPLAEGQRFPRAGMPGDAAWEAMAPADRAAVDRVFVNVAKAIAAFERALRPGPTALDRYAAGDATALSPQARDGLRRFFESGCIQCHHGPRLTDDSFHNIHMPTGRRDGRPDPGRRAGVELLRTSPFRADGPFSDAPDAGARLADLTAHPAMEGQFRTPSLRGVMLTGPWGHGGTFTEMREVMRHYAGRRVDSAPVGASGPLDPHLPGFHMDTDTLDTLVALMEALTPDRRP